jgi:hypothetical protein
MSIPDPRGGCLEGHDPQFNAKSLTTSGCGIGKSARLGALDHLLAEIPSAVVASVTGYNLNTMATRVAVSGTD